MPFPTLFFATALAAVFLRPFRGACDYYFVLNFPFHDSVETPPDTLPAVEYRASCFRTV